ncbi:MAG TPA: RICIN domain-containing protein [Candidatus Limnocylindrales bacterium]|nr:RICIN domain-containing protein [Candidatus Limnocylindrales bacterium]
MFRKASPFVLILLGSLGANAQMPPTGLFNGPGRYEIESVESGQLLDVSEDQETVRQYPRRGSLNQQWDIQPVGNGYFTLQLAEQGKLLSLARGGTREGTHVVVSPRRDTEDQLWQVVSVAPGEFQIISRFGSALDIPHKSHDKGEHLQVWTRTGSENQRFRLIFINAAPSWGGGGSSGFPPSQRRPMDSDDAPQACRTEVNRRILDLRMSDIFVESVSTDAEGNTIVMWKTPRGSSGYCRVDRRGRVAQFKVQEMSQ